MPRRCYKYELGRYWGKLEVIKLTLRRENHFSTFDHNSQLLILTLLTKNCVCVYIRCLETWKCGCRFH